MRNTLNILFFLLLASVLHAQAPVIDHLEVDEVKNQIKIVGSFQSLSGQVSIDDTLVGVVSWSDSLIIAELPMSGRGSGGAIIVQDANGRSNKRTLSIFNATLLNIFFFYYDNPHVGGYIQDEYRHWYATWRADISKRKSVSDSIVMFEVSQSSYGTRSGNGLNEITLPWTDTSIVTDSCMSLNGTIHLNSGVITFGTARQKSNVPKGKSPIVTYFPKSIMYDSTGFLSGYYDTAYCPAPNGPELCRDNRLYNQQMLFPPSPKSAVKDPMVISDVVSASFEVVDNKVKIGLSTPMQAEAVVSLVDILGRKASTLYTGILDEHTTLLTDVNSARGQIMFLEVSMKGIKRYFKLPLVF